MPNRVLIVRPGLIVGEFDPTDRFTYWVMRVASGGEILAPANPHRFVQMIDAQNLARWIIKMAEEDENGIFNATIALSDAAAGWRIALLGKNLADKSYAANRAVAGTHILRSVPRDDQRYFGISARYSF